MAKSVPTAITLPVLAELQANKTVLASTWRTIAAAQHYIYGRQGAHILNVVFDPYWTSLAYSGGGSAYHQIGSGSGDAVDLDRHTAIFRFTRPKYDTGAGAASYSLAMNVYARNLNVRATLVRLDTEDGHTGSVTSLTQLVTNHSSADSEWQVDTQEYTPAQASRSGSTANGLAYILVYLEAQVPASGNGYIHQVALRENPIIAANDIPRGA